MAENDFLAFADAGGANVLSQAAYAALPALSTGFVAGVAPSAGVNKALRQSTAIAAAIGAYLNSRGIDALDNGNIATLAGAIQTAVQKTPNHFGMRYTAATSLTVPAGQFYYHGVARAGGGGGGGSSGSGSSGAGGGGSPLVHFGFYCQPGDVIQINPGGSGQGGNTSPSAGTNGGATAVILNGVTILQISGGTGGAPGNGGIGTPAGVAGGITVSTAALDYVYTDTGVAGGTGISVGGGLATGGIGGNAGGGSNSQISIGAGQNGASFGGGGSGGANGNIGGNGGAGHVDLFS